MAGLNYDFKQLKENLTNQSKKYQHIFDEQLSDIRDNTEKFAKITFMIGGAFVVGYWATKKILKSKKIAAKDLENNTSSLLPAPARQGILSPLMKMFWQSITMFLLGVAKKKLEGFLATAQKHDTPKTGN